MRAVAGAVCLIILLLATGGALRALAQSRQDARIPASAYVVVAPGDTLWDIAASRAPRGADLRYAVYQLREHNQLASANLRVGQRLSLPPGWRPD